MLDCTIQARYRILSGFSIMKRIIAEKSLKKPPQALNFGGHYTTLSAILLSVQCFLIEFKHIFWGRFLSWTELVRRISLLQIYFKF